MATPTTLAECREAYFSEAMPSPKTAEGMPSLTGALRVSMNRAFMQGAMAAVQLQRAGIPLDAVLSECVQFGRAVGTPAERAP